MTTETNETRIVLCDIPLSKKDYYRVQVKTKFLFFYYWKTIYSFNKNYSYWNSIFEYEEAKSLAIAFKNKEYLEKFIENNKNLSNEWEKKCKEYEQEKAKEYNKKRVQYF